VVADDKEAMDALLEQTQGLSWIEKDPMMTGYSPLVGSLPPRCCSLLDGRYLCPYGNCAVQYEAARLNRGAFIRKLVDAGIDVNMKHWATRHTALYVAVKEKHLDCIHILLELNADGTTYTGVCAILILIIIVESLEKCLLVIFHNLCGQAINTPLELAALENYTECVRAILDRNISRSVIPNLGVLIHIFSTACIL